MIFRRRNIFMVQIQPPSLVLQHTPLPNPRPCAGNLRYGGMNAIDLSSFTLRSIVDLTPGASSTFGYTDHIDDNTAIAFGTTIENVFSGSGADDVFGKDADNEIHAGAGDDLITGGAGNDTLLGQADHDTITGGMGNDHVFGSDGHDHLSDAWGNDTLNGGAGTDTLISHLGDNALSGGSEDGAFCIGLGDDELDGGSGDDLLIADYPHRFARGNDTLIGGEGNDKLDGGQGADEFVFFLDQTGNDTIAQFDIDGSLLGAGFEVGQDQIHLITGAGIYPAQYGSGQRPDMGILPNPDLWSVRG
jgi:Ca2+-binding RTX toxin-like protein